MSSTLVADCRERPRAAELAEKLPGVADLLGEVGEGIAVEGMETPLDVVPGGSHVVLLDPVVGVVEDVTDEVGTDE
ncbi:hypothetical protein, partial [Mobilicoccus sp.]|uniref:hypothetical protein n=1 Tax=Mobilicoccus sp. TaxID=2034349 RepID=UPI0028A91AA0